MRINPDFSRPALMRGGDAVWKPSPEPGVERVMLDRVGDEVARATSIVRYAPGSRFGRHTHQLGEEFLVLKGTFSDSQGDYGPGAYVRNPPGSAHAPWSEGGCTIFVKLRQFDEQDLARIAVDTSVSAGWSRVGGGVERLALHRYGPETVALYRFDEGGVVKLDGAGGIELLVVEGGVTLAGTALRRRDWLRLPPGGPVPLRADAPGARVYVKTGHLAAGENAAMSGA